MADLAVKAPKARRTKISTCKACGVDFESGARKKKMHCWDCGYLYYREKAAAQVATRREFYQGRIPHPRKLNCVDCGAPANGYDHRDYLKPLEVEAVCRSCNSKRGPAQWSKWRSPNFFLPKKPVREIPHWVGGEGDAGALL